MEKAKYTVGIDFGTLSARALLVRVSDGAEIGSTVSEYKSGVMDDFLISPSGKIKLPRSWALEDPHDYITALAETVPALLRQCFVSADDVIGIGIDFTTCTLLPVYSDGTPLCFEKKFENEPNAYVKLWKHHGAQKYANILNETAEKRGEKWLARYGGKIDCEWMFPKIWETLDLAPEVYDAADFFIDAADWIVWQLTGEQKRNSCIIGYKAIYGDDGYPSPEFFAALDPRLENVVRDKCTAPIVKIGSTAGYLTEKAASLLGLNKGTAVAPGHADAHVATPALKISSAGKMFALMGTSMPLMLCHREYVEVPGVCGVVRDGLLPDMYGYEAGLCCVGDHFAWFAENLAPSEYKSEAEERGISVLKLLVEKMSALSVGQSGLIALDWWNGNRSVLGDTDLTGVFVGMTLATRAEEMFRALVEATAYGVRMIIDNYREHGLSVDEFIAAGGIAHKDPVTMQIYADVLGMTVKIAGSKQTSSLASAIYAACAAGKSAGGYDSIAEASEKMGSLSDTEYRPIKENSEIYSKLYAEYKKLYNYFGRGENNVMKTLLEIKTSAQK